jgi:hypothetical protein
MYFFNFEKISSDRVSISGLYRLEIESASPQCGTNQRHAPTALPSPEGKAVGAWRWIFTSNAEIENEWSYNFLPPCAFMECKRQLLFTRTSFLRSFSTSLAFLPSLLLPFYFCLCILLCRFILKTELLNMWLYELSQRFPDYLGSRCPYCLSNFLRRP